MAKKKQRKDKSERPDEPAPAKLSHKDFETTLYALQVELTRLPATSSPGHDRPT